MDHNGLCSGVIRQQAGLKTKGLRKMTPINNKTVRPIVKTRPKV